MIAALRCGVVRGIFEPGAQPSRQTGVEVGPGRDVTPEEREHLSPRTATPRFATPRFATPRAVMLRCTTVDRGTAVRGRGSHKDHVSSVPTGCDTSRPLLYPDWCMTAVLTPLASTGNAAFFVIFGIFIVAMIALIVIVIVWAVRHDMAGRQAWRKRQQARAQWPEDPDPGAQP